VRARSFAILSATLLLAACADFGGPVDGSGRRLSPTEARLQAAETKIAELSKRVDSMNQLLSEGGGSRSEDELRSMRGDIEKLRYDLDQLDKRNRDLYQDLDRRLPRAEGGAPSSGMTGASTGAPGAAAPSASENPAAPEEEAAYLQAFDQLKAGRYDDAIAGFKSMIQKWPSGRYADNAWYWMGEAYYVKRDYPSAVQAFRAVGERYPSSRKAPDALLKLGFSQFELKRYGEARTTLNDVMTRFPDSDAAKLAKERLAKMPANAH